MRAHEIEAKKNRHIRRLFSFGGGLNSRDCDAEDQGNYDTGSNERGDHGPIIVAFNAERFPVRVLVSFEIIHQLILRNLDPRIFSYNARPSAPVSFNRRVMVAAWRSPRWYALGLSEYM